MTPDAGSASGRAASEGAVLHAEGVVRTFKSGGKVNTALAGITLSLAPGTVTGLLGPDGAGKTTFMRMATGLLLPDAGSITVLGCDTVRDALAIQSRVGYMPQRFGLYEDLTVAENLALYGDLQGVDSHSRSERWQRLLSMTDLAPFTGRLAGRLSGGMKQKLGLACALVRSSEVLILDEPTVGVDPLSRKELWDIVYGLVRKEGITVLLSTAYLDEAQRCDRVVVFNKGRIIGDGPPQEYVRGLEGCAFRLRPRHFAGAMAASAAKQGSTAAPSTFPSATLAPSTHPAAAADVPSIERQAALAPDSASAADFSARVLQDRIFRMPGVMDATVRNGQVEVLCETPQRAATLPVALFLEPRPVRFEDGFMALFHDGNTAAKSAGASPDALASVAPVRPATSGTAGESIIEVRGLERRFGNFLAVHDLSFKVGSGEVFGLLGPNGAGKSTTFRMLCGLLPPSAGTLRVAGVDLRTAAAKARQQVGYMAQKFSQYGSLSVRENLEFFAGAYGLRGTHRRERITWALDSFELGPWADMQSGTLPLGLKQRLAFGCALMHQPHILFLDEATSGIDPFARRDFWGRITALAQSGVTVVVTTHFLEEAEYCDRIAILVEGSLLALGTPDEVRALGARAADDMAHRAGKVPEQDVIASAMSDMAQRAGKGGAASSGDVAGAPELSMEAAFMALVGQSRFRAGQVAAGSQS